MNDGMEAIVEIYEEYKEGTRETLKGGTGKGRERERKRKEKKDKHNRDDGNGL
jgi:hypothetical protein